MKYPNLTQKNQEIYQKPGKHRGEKPDSNLTQTRLKSNSNPTQTQLKPNSNPTQTQLKPDSNPIQTKLKPNSNPTQTQLKPNQNPTFASQLHHYTYMEMDGQMFPEQVLAILVLHISSLCCKVSQPRNMIGNI